MNWSESDYPINPLGAVTGLDCTLDHLFKKFTFEAGNTCFPLRIHDLPDDSRTFSLRTLKDKGGKAVIDDRKTKRKTSVAYIVWLLTRGVLIPQLHRSRVSHLDGNQANNHPLNLAYRFLTVDAIPDYLKQCEPSQTLPRAVQFNTKHQLWQVLFIRNGHHFFTGFYLTFKQAQKAYVIACLYIGMMSYSERLYLNEWKSKSRYLRKVKPMQYLERALCTLENEDLNQRQQPDPKLIAPVVTWFRECGELGGQYHDRNGDATA